MRVLALDQATNVTAWCLWDNGAPSKFGLIDLHLEKAIELRMEEMCQYVRYLIYHYSPSLLAIEDVSFQRDPNALINLARLQGRIIQIAYDFGIPVVFYKPSAWRSAVGIQTGKGIKREQLKQAAMELIEQQYGVKVVDDIAEAICIGKCALMKTKGF